MPVPRRHAALVVALLACTPRTSATSEPASSTSVTMGGAPPYPPARPADTPAPSLSASPPAAAEKAPSPIVREERTVTVDGQVERWSLVFTSAPEPDCFDEGWQSCRCFGKELGERGPLALVRRRANGDEQRLPLGTVTLPRFHLDLGDAQRFPKKVDMAAVRHRPLVEVMRLGDYDQDGRATEIVIERGDEMCGFHGAVAVGVSRLRDELHVFATADTPAVPIDLPHASDWEQIRRGLPTEMVYIPCGFQGGWPTYEMIHVSRDAAGLHARHRRYACNWTGGTHHPGKRLLDRPWTGAVQD